MGDYLRDNIHGILGYLLRALEQNKQFKVEKGKLEIGSRTWSDGFMGLEFETRVLKF